MKEGCAPLFIACKKGNVEIVEYLITICNADVEQRGKYEVPDDRSVHNVTPLWCAAVAGKLPVVKCLVQYGADVDRFVQHLPNQIISSKPCFQMVSFYF
jgi:ankyrin repeat protein